MKSLILIFATILQRLKKMSIEANVDRMRCGRVVSFGGFMQGFVELLSPEGARV